MKTNRKPFIKYLYILPLILSINSPAQASDYEKNIAHLSTNYPLYGAHIRVGCTLCHIRGIFKGTPKTCSACHTQGPMMRGSTKHASHIPSSNDCDECHGNSSWWPARGVNHSRITDRCFSCHNSRTAMGKHNQHIVSNDQCEHCHSTQGWTPAAYNHSSAQE